jgi:hypothetical protein
MMEFLKKIWAAWKKVGQFIGDMIARVVLTIFYFTIFVPVGIGVRLASDPLRMKEPGEGSFWQPRKTTDLTIHDVERQF